MAQPLPETVLFFDGVCNLCNSSVQFVICHDKAGKIKFATLQSAAGTEAKEAILKKQGRLPDSLILYHKDKWYTESDAALQLAGLLDGSWKALKAFIIFPEWLRNWVYRLVSKNRYFWWGKKNHCMMPTPALKARFLDT